MYRNWDSKPPVGTQIDWSHPLATNLLWFSGALEGRGTLLADQVAGVNLATEGSATWTTGSMSALSCASTGYGAQGIIPSRLQIPLPITLIVACRWNGAAPSANAHIHGMFVNNTGSSPNAYRITWDSTPTYVIPVLAVGATGTTSWAPTANADVVIASEFTSASAFKWYVNGTLNTSGSFTGGVNPTWTATSNISIGQPVGLSARNAQVIVYWAGIWAPVLPAAIHAAIGSSVNAIWEMFPMRRIYGRPASAVWRPWYLGDQINEMYG